MDHFDSFDSLHSGSAVGEHIFMCGCGASQTTTVLVTFILFSADGSANAAASAAQRVLSSKARELLHVQVTANVFARYSAPRGNVVWHVVTLVLFSMQATIILNIGFAIKQDQALGQTVLAAFKRYTVHSTCLLASSTQLVNCVCSATYLSGQTLDFQTGNAVVHGQN